MNKKIFFIAVISLLIDQISKISISIFLALDERMVLIKNFFSFYHIHNYGASWSILNYKVNTLIVITFIALFIIFRYMYSFQKNKRNNIAFGLLLGGLCGNLIDRIFLGYVRDFLSFKIINYHYPIFNIADSCIVLGVFLLIIAVIKGEDKNENSSRK